MKSLVTLVAISASALAGTTDDRIPDSAYVDYAVNFAPFAARITVRDAKGKIYKGTATPISDHWALTAGHVVEGGVSATITSNANDFASTDIVIHEQFDSDRLGYNDIALVRVSKPFGLKHYPPLGTEQDTKPGDLVTLAGYGFHGPMSSGYTSTDGRLRAGTNRVERFERTVIICTAGGRSPLEFCISPGDSGGPMFTAGADGRLVGIASFTMADHPPLRSRRGEESAHTRVGLFREWIRKVTGGGE
jgi:S1-C subfamily serine protease